MKYYGANPIYDTVFKYLMEDERVATTILSALLKKKVVAVSQRANECSNVTKNDLSRFRIDFGAIVRNDDGFCFDQTNCWAKDRQVIEIDDSLLSGNPDMEYIMHRLVSAAADPEVRQHMNVEDEFFSAIEERDTAVMLRDKRIEEQNRIIEQQDNLIEQKENLLEQKENLLEQKDNLLEQKEKALQATVKALKAAGLPADKIAKMTGLAEVYIKSI